MPVSWHFLTHLTYTWWSVHYFANEGYSGRVTSPLSPQHPGESGKSCCPLVMMECAEEPQEKKKRKRKRESSFLLSVCVCLYSSACLFHSLSACALLLCHPRGCIWRRPSVDPFVSCFASCATASLLSMISLGLSPAHSLCCCQQALGVRRVCCWGWGRRLCPNEPGAASLVFLYSWYSFFTPLEQKQRELIII